MQGADHVGPRNCQQVLGSEVWAKRMKLQLAATGPVSDPSSTRTVPCRVTRVVTDSESESQNPGSAHDDLAQGELGRARRAGPGSSSTVTRAVPVTRHTGWQPVPPAVALAAPSTVSGVRLRGR